MENLYSLPAKNYIHIDASSLPIYADAVECYPHLKDIQIAEDAAIFCEMLRQLDPVSVITIREYEIIDRVANGELWPNCLVLKASHRDQHTCRIMSARDIAFFLQPSMIELLDEWHVYRVDAHGAAEELQAELDATHHAVKFWTAGGDLVATGVYPEH